MTFQKYFKRKQQPPLNKLFKKAVRYQLFDLNSDTYTHKACKIIASNKDIVMLHMRWDFFEMIPALSNEKEIRDIYDTMECGYYSTTLEHLSDFTYLILADSMEAGKIIYVVLNIENYEMDAFERGNEYGHHCTSLIFHPKENGDYDCFYITSHGEDMTLTKNFDIRHTRRRCRRISFDEPIDVVCVKRYLAFLGEAMRELECRITIHYDETKNHNYYGPNLQCGDDYGVCFAFPLIIWYYLTNFYNKKRMIEENGIMTQIPSMKCLLEQKSLIFLVNSCFHTFHKKYTNIFIESMIPRKKYALRGTNIYNMDKEENTYKRVHKYTKLDFEDIVLNRKIEDILKRSGFIFIKRIALGIISMISESYINRIIY